MNRLWFPLLAATACGRVDADAAPSAAARPDAGLTTVQLPPTPCPARVDENSPCYRASSVCEYGTSPDADCNRRFVCAVDGSYGMYWTEEHRGQCAKCPDPSAIVDGAPCDVGDGGGATELTCLAGEATCACTIGADGAHVHARRWACTRPAAGCPPVRPLLGQGCDGEGRTCDYGACAAARGMQMKCESAVWRVEAASCP